MCRSLFCPLCVSDTHHLFCLSFPLLHRPIYTGFFFKIWDQLFNTQNPGPCTCAQCRPKRTLKDWEAVVRPDYSVLLSPAWWLSTDTNSLLKSGSGKLE